jgi:hypothetical protein
MQSLAPLGGGVRAAAELSGRGRLVGQRSADQSTFASPYSTTSSSSIAARSSKSGGCLRIALEPAEHAFVPLPRRVSQNRLTPRILPA